MDLTPRPDAGRLLIQSYGDGGFRIGGIRHDGNVIVAAGRVLPWPVRSVAETATGDVRPLIDTQPRPDVVLIGGGARAEITPPSVRAALAAAGISVETMDTGAACRTFNVLALEGRRVAAALIAVD